MLFIDSLYLVRLGSFQSSKFLLCANETVAVLQSEIFSSMKLSKFADEKIAYNFYTIGTIAFYYAVLNYLYSDQK
jgi:hypothetical protein